jgi:hypothetical protein
MRTRLSLLAALLAALLAGGSLAGCGGDTGDGSAQPGDTAQTGGTVPGDPGSTALPPSGRVYPPSDPAQSKNTTGEMTITGQVVEGVESGCLVMQSGGTTYQLIGGDKQVLRAGSSVVVRGRPNPGLATICQQGTPFEVTEVRPA